VTEKWPGIWKKCYKYLSDFRNGGDFNLILKDTFISFTIDLGKGKVVFVLN
jgi:hypothetical protein